MDESSIEDNDTVNLVVGCNDAIVDEVGGVFEEMVWHTPRHVTEEGFHVLSEEDVEESRVLLEQLDRHYAEQRSAEVRAYRNSLTSILAKRAAARVCASSLFSLWRPGAAAAAAADLQSEVVRRVCLYIPLAGEKVAQLFLQGGATAEGLDSVVRSAAGGNIAQYVRHIAIDGMMLGVVAATVVEAAGSTMLVVSGKLDPSNACTRVAKNVACTGVGVMAGAAAASAAALLIPSSPLAAPIATTLAHFAASWGARKKLDDDAVKATDMEAKRNLAARIAASAARAVWRRESGDDEVVRLPYRESVEVVDGVDGGVASRVVEVVDGVVVPVETEGEDTTMGDKGENGEGRGSEEAAEVREEASSMVRGRSLQTPKESEGEVVNVDEDAGAGADEGTGTSEGGGDALEHASQGAGHEQRKGQREEGGRGGVVSPPPAMAEGVDGVTPLRGPAADVECKRPCLGVRGEPKPSRVARSIADVLGSDDLEAARYFDAPEAEQAEEVAV